MLLDYFQASCRLQMYYFVIVEAFTLAMNGSNVIEIEQGKDFNIEVCCQTVDGDVTSGKHF